MKATEPIEDDINAIQDIDSTQLKHQQIEEIDNKQLNITDEDEKQDITTQNQKREQLKHH